MCGIVGYVGQRPVLAVLLEGLRRLEYRGYDSAGVVVFESPGVLRVIKRKGRVYDLEEEIYRQMDLHFQSPGLGHTRWATHGEPNDMNAHPHFDCFSQLAVVHNGIIENFQDLKEELIKKGHRFKSDTDTEVVAHLVEEYLREASSLLSAFLKALSRLRGAFAIGMISLKEPGNLYVARFQSPAVVGIGDGENFLASDIPALLPFTKRVVFLKDAEVALLTPEGVKFYDFDGRPLSKDYQIVTWDVASAEKGGYSHFMLKEIYEQPEALQQTLLGRLNLIKGQVDFSPEGLTPSFVSEVNKVQLVACGTSYHACMVGKYLLERVLPFPVEVDLASEFRYRKVFLDEKTLYITLSQSGETADTLASLRLAKEKGAKVLTICNVVGSTMTRESDIVLYTQAGPEISVASTKAFTTQVLMLILLSCYLQGIFQGTQSEKTLSLLSRLSLIVKNTIEEVHEGIKVCAQRWYGVSNFFYLGRNILYPIALEGALKLKEISYIHAEGYAAGEMKHGPIALIEENFPTLILSAKEMGIIHEKTCSNAEEIRARKGPLIIFTTKGASEFVGKSDFIFYLPETDYCFLPIIYVIPLQLLAYEIAFLKGCDIDKPRNLAKSVTVE